MLFALTVLALSGPEAEGKMGQKSKGGKKTEEGVWKFREEWLSNFLVGLSNLQKDCEEHGSNTLN